MQQLRLFFAMALLFTLHVSGDNSTHHQEYNAVYGLSSRQVYCKLTKSVKPLRRINAIVASCWIYFTMLSWLELLINPLLLHLVGVYIIYLNDARSKKYQTFRWTTYTIESCLFGRQSICVLNWKQTVVWKVTELVYLEDQCVDVMIGLWLNLYGVEWGGRGNVKMERRKPFRYLRCYSIFLYWWLKENPVDFSQDLVEYKPLVVDVRFGWSLGIRVYCL